ncbi:MAG TPA: hypothetical protein VD999_05565 [Vitreimonas sp.]|nr:hypothetical protein [Vitreimonas sp.]
MKLEELLASLKKISTTLDEKYPLQGDDTRILARFMKYIEEQGEFADAFLASKNLQRSEKQENHQVTNLENEYADVVSTLLLLGIELGIDIEAVMKRKLTTINKRLEIT